MANSCGQFTGWVSVSDILKSEPNCTDGRFDEALYMENALMQQPSHMYLPIVQFVSQASHHRL